MASSSTAAAPGDMDSSVHAEPPGVTTYAVAPEVPPDGEDSFQEPRRLPDICNLEWQREGMPDTEFNRKYPPDAWGEEAAPNARVWKVYRDHHTISDRSMLDSWNKTLDVLLIFAGLFSAVSTAFLVESYKALQPDYTQYMAAFLYAAAASHNRTGGVFPPLDAIGAPDGFIKTSVTQRWTNGLWFSSLVISLTVALLCILIKQWLEEYDSHISAATPSPQYWVRRHRMYYRGLRTWGVLGLISFLPLLLHVSLFLFFGGLILFVFPLDGTIAYTLLVMASSIFTFYGVSFILPAWRIDCPSYTPLLPQALLIVSRGFSCLLCLVRALYRLFDFLLRRFNDYRVYMAILAIMRRVGNAARLLESIRTRSQQQLVRERNAINKWDLELDGYALSAFINLPFESNSGMVHTTCAAIGAITSARTTEIISKSVSAAVFHDRIVGCYSNVYSKQRTGFAITAHAQLQRTFQVMVFHNEQRWKFRTSLAHAFGLRSSLGIDGLLLHAMGVQDADHQPFDIDLLVRSLQSLLGAGDRPHGCPLRSTCLMFLEHHSRYPRENGLFLPCFLLVFCAGQFEKADTDESVRALRSLETVLRMQCSITIPLHRGEKDDYICAVTNCLSLMLVDPERHQLDTLTAQAVADNACQWASARLVSERWDRMQGLSAFIRSPSFRRYVSTSDSLATYIEMFIFWPRVAKCALTPMADYMSDYWICIATLLKLSWEYVPLPNDASSLSRTEHLFPIEPSNWILIEILRNGSLYATQDDWYEPGLSAFLDSPSSIATWKCAGSPCNDDRSVRELATLAVRIAVLLCRRTRLHRANDAFIRGFFSGSFLLSRFLDLVSREHIPSPEWQVSFADLALDLARHCLKLSTAGCLEIFTQLEEIGDADSELRTRAVAFAQRIRDGTLPGGALSAECSPDCPCTTESIRAPRGWRDVWSGVTSRFRRGDTNISPAENV